MDAQKFLQVLAQALSTMALYKPGHPARERAVDRAFALLKELQVEDPHPDFSFLGDEVIYGNVSVRELRDWDWSKRFVGIGVQRLEFELEVTRDDFVAFLEDVALKFATPGGVVVDTAEARQTGPRHTIRYGSLGIRSDTEEGKKLLEKEIQTATITYEMNEEIDSIKFMHDEVLKNGGLPLLEAEAVVRSLSVAMHGESEMMLPLLMLKDFDQYTTTHCLNVSVLVMGLAEHLGLHARDVRTFGIAGLLHDLGKVKIPMEILNKPGKLTDDERTVMQNHTIEGAKLIITSDRELDMAAAVAYEHHIMLNGGGYPKRHYQRDCHKASNLVHVCDVYDALRTNRPYRAAWEAERVLGYIAEKSGSEFEPEIATKFVELMRKMEGRLARVEYPEGEAVAASPTAPSAPPAAPPPPAAAPPATVPTAP